MEVKPKLIQMKSYRFSNDKIESITVDSTLNYDEHMNSLDERLGAFNFYIKDQYDIEENELTNDVKKYLTEYMSLPASDRRTYRTYASLQGTLPRGLAPEVSFSKKTPKSFVIPNFCTTFAPEIRKYLLLI